MNIKRFTLLTASTLLVVAAIFTLESTQKAQYFPKSIDSNKPNIAGEYVKFMQSIKADPETGTIDQSLIEAANKQMETMPKDKALDFDWKFKGPDNVGGRTRALIIDRNDNQHLLAGGVAGGVWESFDGAESWQPYDPEFKVKNISTITQAVDGSFYVGTGEQFANGGTVSNTARGVFFVGTGLHKLLGGAAYQTIVEPVTRINVSNDWATFGQIEASKTDPNRLYVGMVNGFRILDIVSTDSVTVTNPITETGNARCNDVEILSSGRILASFDNFIYASDDGGNSFTRVFDISVQEPRFNGAARIETAVAPSNNNIIYAAAGGLGGSVCVVGIFRSRDGGNNWESIAPFNTPTFNYLGNTIGCQAFWNNAIAVDPLDPGKITVAGVTMQRWVQSSVDPARANGSWTPIDATQEFFGDIYVHADKHKIIYDPNDPNTAYIASDGGVGKSRNFNSATPTYTQNNFKYAVTQFYGIGANQNGIVMAGSQDNGTQLIGLDFNSGFSSVEVQGGDGFDAKMSKIDPSIGFATLYFNIINRIQGIGSKLSNSNFSQANIVNTNTFLGGLCQSRNGFCTNVFYNNIELWESLDHTGSRDSVMVRIDTTDLPPITGYTVKDTVIGGVSTKDTTFNFYPFESNNNDRPQSVKFTEQFLFPSDTLIGDIVKQTASVPASGILQVISDYDTIVVNVQSKQLFFRYRDGSRETRNYTDGVPVVYDNAFLQTDDEKSEILVNGLRVTYLNSEITFRYIVPAQDRVQTIFASSNWPQPGGTGINLNARNVFITRDLLKGQPQINWYQVAGSQSTPDPVGLLSNGASDNILTMEFSRDGNHLFIGTQLGFVYRVSGINQVTSDLPQSVTATFHNIVRNQLKDSCVRIGAFGGSAITDISVDPNDANNVIVVSGNYTNNPKIRRCDFALTAGSTTGSSNFTIIEGSGTTALPRVPAYSVLIDVNDHNTVLIGTETGIFATENAFDPDGNNVQWSEENTGMGRVPVFSMEQMLFGSFEGINGPADKGTIFLGTHGRGVYQSDKLVGIEEQQLTDVTESKDKLSLKLYPNPVRENAKIELNLVSNGNVNIQVMNINGQLVTEKTLVNQSRGKSTIDFSFANLNNGTYIIRAVQNDKVYNSKFVLYK